MGRYGDTKSVCPQVGHLTKEIYRLLRISVFQLPVCRTHPTHGLDPAGNTLGLPSESFLPDLRKKVPPPLIETPFAEVVAGTLRQNAKTEHAIRINGKGVNPASAVIKLVSFFRRVNLAGKPLVESLPLYSPLRIHQVQFHDLSR